MNDKLTNALIEALTSNSKDMVQFTAYGKVYYEMSKLEYENTDEEEIDNIIIDVAEQASEEEGHTVETDEVEILGADDDFEDIEESKMVTEGNLYNYEYIIYRQRATKAPLYVKDYSTETENISEAVAFPTQKEAEEYKEELELEHKEQYKIGIKNDRKDENKELTESKENNSVEELLDLLDKVNITNKQRAFCEFTGISMAQLNGSQGFNERNAKVFIPKVKEWLAKNNQMTETKEIEYISRKEYDKLPADYKTTIAQTLKARQAVGDNVEELRKLYKDLGYDEEDPMIMANEKGGTILKPVKIQESENELRHQELNNNIVDNSFDIDDMKKRLDKTFINENKTEKCEITETIINKLNEAYSSNNNVSDNKEDGFTYAKILVDFFDDIDYEKWNEERDTSKREDMVRPNMKAFVDRYGKELINRPNTIQGMFDYLEDWNYHTQYGVLKQELDKFMQDNDTKLTESSKLEDYWDATIVAKDDFMTLLKFNFGSDLHHNNYMITLDANDVKRFYADNDKEAISIYEQFKTEWQNSDHVSADLNVQPLVTENNSNATLNQSNMKSDKTTLTNNENGLKVPNKLNETNTQRYTVYIIEEPNEDCSPYTIYDNECDDFYFDENGFNPVFDTETETEQYIKENLIK